MDDANRLWKWKNLCGRLKKVTNKQNKIITATLKYILGLIVKENTYAIA